MKHLPLSDSLSLPLDSATEKIAWLGRTGGGKSYGAMKLAELMLEAGIQIGVIDPVGVWRSLRVPAVAGGRAFEVVVFGGLYGDLPLEPTAGEIVADLVCDRGLSFVLDVSQFIPSEQQRFVRAFADRFFHRKKSAPSAVHLFMEECQEFIPENPSGLEAQTLGVMQRLWKLGRNYGIGGSLISQRPQEIAKKALNMSGTLFCFQMTGPQERKAIRAWVADHGVAVDIESVLQKLHVGEPHVESPMFLRCSRTIRISQRITADLSSTPKVGASPAARRPLTPVDVENLKSAMSDTIERAKAQDPKELQKQIADLRKQLAAKPAAAAPPKPEPPKIVEVPVLTDSQIERLEGIADKLIATLRAVVAQERFLRSEVDAATRKLASAPVTPVARPTPAPRVNRATSGEPQNIGGGLRRMMVALAQRNGLSARQLGVRAGMSSSSGTFGTYLAKGRTEGWLDGSRDRIMITDAGRDALGSYDPLPEGAELLAYWLGELTGGARSMLAVLAEHPNGLTAEQLGGLAGLSHGSGTFGTYLSKLRTLELITGGRDNLRASEELF